jgi:flagellar basal-body rod modification protein FlgD
MNKDDFLKLFMEQLKHQDPLKPQDASAMLDQLSQLTLVEQSYNNTTAMNNLLAAQNNATNLSSVSFIGKEVRAQGNALNFDGVSPATVEFNLAGSTASTDIVITDSTGRVVKKIKAGALSAGDKTIPWDGRNDGGTMMPTGAYKFSIVPTTASGSTVASTTFTSGKIGGIDFTSGKPMLMIGPVAVPFVDVISVKGA